MASDRWEGMTEINQQLLNLVAAQRATTPSAGRSNVGGWHSDLNFLDTDSDCVRSLVARLHDFTEKVMQQFANPSAPVGEFSLEGWANVLDPGGYNSVHSHPNAEWSGVYYVTGNRAKDAQQPPGDSSGKYTGKLELMDPRTGAALTYAEGSTLYGRFLIDPVPGQVVLFPGWLPHQVHPYQGAEARTSIAFNTLRR